MRTSLAFLFLLCATPAFAQREYGFDNRKPSGQPYISPEETVKRMKVPDEFEVKLFAGEPLMTNPIAFTIDEKGRIWLVECFEYPKRTPKGKAPRDRIVILEDTNGDGVADKRTVFAEGKDFPVPEEPGLGAFDLWQRYRGRTWRGLHRRTPVPLVHREQGRQARQVRGAPQGLRQSGHARDAQHLPVGPGRLALRPARGLHSKQCPG
jgi:hypothetical protein